MHKISSLSSLDAATFDSVPILRATISAGRRLAELKGVAATIPNQDILISTLAMQEAKDSSAIENIVTTHDELFRNAAFTEATASPAAKEVRHYTEALRAGYDTVRAKSVLSNRLILDIQATLEGNTAGFRTLPGTVLKDNRGRTVYTPPQSTAEIAELMSDLERFINDDRLDVDPLVKMAIIHHQFESIHPFYDGNGRTGRIINVLYLVLNDLLDTPVLYLSRAIVRTKPDYYRLLQSVRTSGEWEPWILYVLDAVQRTASETIFTISAIHRALVDYTRRIRERYRFYSRDLVNNLFQHPYTKIEFITRDLGVSRLTAAKYLDTLARDGFLAKRQSGRTNYYANRALVDILTNVEAVE